MTLRRDAPWYQWLIFSGQAVVIHGLGLGLWSRFGSPPPPAPPSPLPVLLVPRAAPPEASDPPPPETPIRRSPPETPPSRSPDFAVSSPKGRSVPSSPPQPQNIHKPIQPVKPKQTPIKKPRPPAVPVRPGPVTPAPLPAVPSPPVLPDEPAPLTPPPSTPPEPIAETNQGRVSFGSIRLSQPDRDLPDQWAQPLGDPPLVTLPPQEDPWTVGQGVTLEVLILVHTDGSVTLFPEQTRVLQGALDPLIAGAWVQTQIKTWRFSPTLSAGQPVEQEYWWQLAIEAIGDPAISP